MAPRIKKISAQMQKGLSDEQVAHLVLKGLRPDDAFLNRQQLIEIWALANVPSENAATFDRNIQQVVVVTLSNYYFHCIDTTPIKVSNGKAVQTDQKTLGATRQFNELGSAASRLLKELGKLSDEDCEIIAKDGATIETLRILRSPGLEACLRQLIASAKRNAKKRGGQPKNARVGDANFPCEMFIKNLCHDIYANGGNTKIGHSEKSDQNLSRILKVMLPVLPSDLLPEFITDPDQCINTNGLRAIERQLKNVQKTAAARTPTLAKILLGYKFGAASPSQDSK